MSAAYLWHVLPGRRWPSSASEERSFIERLRVLCPPDASHPPGPRRFDRGDVVMVLNVLRCGSDLDEVLEMAPGADPCRMLWAYEHLEDRLVQARAAFAATLEVPSDIADPSASALMPVPVARIRAVYARLGPERAMSVRDEIVVMSTAVGRKAADVESELVEVSTDQQQWAVRRGRMLYDPYGLCLWGHPFFLPPRVGTLTPVRVRDLLGERPV